MMLSALQPSRILVIQTAFLGDVVLTTPLFTALKKLYPQSALSVLVIPPFDQLLTGHPALSDIILFDKKGREKGSGATWRLARRLHARNFDLAVIPHRSMRSAFIARLAGIPARVGFRSSWGRPLYTLDVPRDLNLPEVERILKLAAALGYQSPEPIYPTLTVSPQAKEKAISRLKTAGINDGQKLAAVLPGSVWGTKRWPAASFAEVIQRLHQNLGLVSLLLGGKEDSGVGEEIMSRLKIGALNLIGKTDLSELTALLALSVPAIGNDTGPMHIAAALGKPTISIFGPTTPAQGFLPYSAQARVVQIPLPCRPCSPHGPQTCPRRHFRCMRDLTPAMVYAEVEKSLVS